MFWPQVSVGEGLPDCLDLDYEAQPNSDHMAEFHGNRLKELGDLVAK